MTITHHPSNVTLSSFAAGTLDEGRSLVVAAHLSLCPACQKTLRAFEHVGGALLDRTEPAAMRADALSHALKCIEAQDPSQAAIAPSAEEIPGPMAQYEFGAWRWLGRGVQWRSINVPSEEGTRVFMLKAQPGIKLPHHAHAGLEWTCVLEGAFRHDGGRYGAGDFDEADETVEHDPVVENAGPCICVVALQGNIVLKGFFGRLLQPLVRF